MTLSPGHSDELLGMIDAMREGMLNIDDEERLSQLVVDDGEVCQLVVDYLDQCAILEWRSAPLHCRSFFFPKTGTGPGGPSSSRSLALPDPAAPLNPPIPLFPISDPTLPPNSDTSARASRIPQWLIPTEFWLDVAPVVVFCTLLLVVGALFGYSAAWMGNDQVADPQFAQPNEGALKQKQSAGDDKSDRGPPPLYVPTLATFKSGGQCRELQQDKKLRVGAQIRAGDRLTFSGGPAELLFLDGARLLIESPSVLDVVAMREVKLRSGLVVVDVSKQRARGFKVTINDWEVIDVGTQFGVISDSELAAEVYVFSGRVDLISNKQAADGTKPPPLHLQTGDARRMLTGGGAERFEFSRDRFSQLLESEVLDIATRQEAAVPVVPPAPVQVVPLTPEEKARQVWTAQLDESFNGRTLDPKVWGTVKPLPLADMPANAAPPAARVENGQLAIVNGCYVVSSQEYNAEKNPVRIRGTWTVDKSGDSLGVMLRSARPKEGLVFYTDAWMGGISGWIDTSDNKGRLRLFTNTGRGEGLIKNEAVFEIPMPGETYEYEIVDDGQGVTMSVSCVLESGEVRKTTVSIKTPSVHFDKHHLVLHNFPVTKQVQRTLMLESLTIETLDSSK